ncbi:MAG: hypothetical protein ACRD2T_11915 [Thermoanaerobaculia bacterium]
MVETEEVTEEPHLRPPEAQHLLAYLPPREQVVLGHILDCTTCQQLVARLLAPGVGPAAERVHAQHDYSEVRESLAAAAEQGAERLVGERQVAEGVVARLLVLDSKERRRRSREEPRFRSLSAAYLLLERSAVAAAATPEEAEDLALLALLMLDCLGPDEEPRQLVAELKVRAWGLVAHACWIAERWDATREALERAEGQLVEAGLSTTGLGFRRAVAAFRIAERRSAEAFVYLTRAVKTLVGRLLPEAPLPAQPEPSAETLPDPPAARTPPRDGPGETEN